MRLSLAVAFLGQTVPTLSKRHHPAVQRDGALTLTTEDIITGKSWSNSILDHGDERGLRRNQRVKRNLAKTMKNTPSFLNAMIPCDPTSSDADVGILSCREDQVCQPSTISSLGGLCTPLPVESNHHAHNHDGHSILPWKESPSNLDPQGTDIEECDPTLVDIGILVCGEGRYCQHDETSELGGLCLDSLNHNSRRLQYTDLDYSLDYCGAYPAEAPYRYCDCTGVNTDTGTGTIVCSQNTTAQGVQGCDEYVVYNFFSYSFENSALVKIHDCYETNYPLAEKICFTYDLANPAMDCYTDWNDQRCISCATSAYSTSFNCSNVGGRVGDYWVERLSVFDTCPNSTCTSVCGAGFYIPEANMPTNVTIGYYLLTCRSLSLFGEHQLIADMDCPAYSQAAQTYCCAPAPVATVPAPTEPVPAPTEPVPAPPAPVPVTSAPTVTPADSGNGGSKNGKKGGDSGNTSDGSDIEEPKQTKGDRQRLRA